MKLVKDTKGPHSRALQFTEQSPLSPLSLLPFCCSFIFLSLLSTCNHRIRLPKK